MSRSRRALPLAAAALTAGLLVTACAREAPLRPEPGLSPLPLTAWIEANLSDTSEQDANPAIGIAVAECMADLGFEYIPLPPTANEPTGPTPIIEPSGAERGTREFAEQYGFGIAWQAEHVVLEGESSEEEGSDPNAAILESMTQSERDAYELALHGTSNAPPTPGEPQSGFDWRDGGCVGKVSHELAPHTLAYRSATWLSLSSEIYLIDPAVQGDPAVVAARDAWQACMAESGFVTYADPSAVESSLREESFAFVRWSESAVVDTEGLRAFAAKEAEAAVADFDCRASSDYDAVRHRAQSRLEQEFLDKHAAELDAWLEEYWSGAQG